MKLERNHLIIGLVLIVIAGLFYSMSGQYTTYTLVESLTVKIDDVKMGQDEMSIWDVSSEMLSVYVIDIDYTDDAFNTYVEPGEEVTYNIVVCDDGEPLKYRYAATISIVNPVSLDIVEGKTWSSPIVSLSDWECIDYFPSLDSPMTPGIYKVLSTSYTNIDYNLDYVSEVDDTDWFYLHVLEPTPTPTATPTPYPTSTPTATITSTPTATVTLTITPTSTPPDNGDTGDITPILLWGGGIIGVLLLLLLVLRAKK